MIRLNNHQNSGGGQRGDKMPRAIFTSPASCLSYLGRNAAEGSGVNFLRQELLPIFAQFKLLECASKFFRRR